MITNIKNIDEYNFDNLPIVNGRGFKLNIYDENSLKSFLVEYKEINKNNTNEFWNKWANINTYRNIIFN